MKLKNSGIFLLAFSLFLGSCAKEEMAPPYEQPVDKQECNAYILAYAPVTKVSVSDDYAKLSWTPQDTLSVYTTRGRFVDFVYDSNQGDGIVRFKGSLEDGEKTDRYAALRTPNATRIASAHGSNSITTGRVVDNSTTTGLSPIASFVSLTRLMSVWFSTVMDFPL